MQIAAVKLVTESTEGNIATFETIYLVEPGETVESLLRRMGLTGSAKWHYSDAGVMLKLIKPTEA
jgi:hypothetical protein